MPKFAANINFLFTEVDFLQRFAAARKAGFGAVEFPFPYPYEHAALAAAAKDAGVEVVLFNLPPGNWEKGERGIACHPDRIAEFRDGVAKAIAYARTLKCPRVNCLAGVAPKDADPERLRATFVENLRYAAAAFAKEGVTLVMEPINPRTIPAFYLNTTKQALDIMRAVGAANLKIQYDIFHMQIVEGDLAKTIEANLANIGHIQFADVPDRHEPGTGEVNFDFLFDWIDRVGYPGWIGAEYVPAKGTVASLGWLKRHSK
ncbi:MAG TPA: hydroxypyruvate isomerase [Burkholderiales bacterium]|nr:hydroxypyruvate isomerase [Burkholderiales bacterium]